MAARGLRLSPDAGHAGRLRARRRRHEIQSRERSRRRLVGDVPGRRLRPPQLRPGLHRRRAGLWLAGRDDRSRRAARTATRANFDANAISGRLEAGYRYAFGASGLTPYAAGQFTTLLPAGLRRAGGRRREHLRAVLCREGRHGVAQRARPARRHARSRCRTRSSPCAAAPPGRTTSTPSAASRRSSRRFRRRASSSTARHRRATPRWCRAGAEAAMAERLLGRRHLRRRVLERHRELRRQGRRALSVVTRGAPQAPQRAQRAALPLKGSRCRAGEGPRPRWYRLRIR